MRAPDSAVGHVTAGRSSRGMSSPGLIDHCSKANTAATMAKARSATWTPHRWSPRAGRAPTIGRLPVLSASAARRSVSATTAADSGRLSASRSRHARTISRTWNGALGASSSSERILPESICCTYSSRVFPSKGSCPVRHRNMTTPSENRSVRPSSGRPSACSGAMYCGVPGASPGIVRALAGWVSVSLVGVMRAMPKSSSLM